MGTYIQQDTQQTQVRSVELLDRPTVFEGGRECERH